MVALMSRTKANVIPAVLLWLCFLHVMTADIDLDSSDVLDSPQDGLAEKMREFFRSLVRKRRQLPKREDLDKKGFTDIEKEAMLALHNAHRSTVNPTAANMIEMRWDNDIEAFAQTWSENCNFNHRSDRSLGAWINMGENLFFSSAVRYLEKTAVDNWWNENLFYSHDDKTCDSGKECGHYITVAWANSEYFGCGITRCDNLGGLGFDVAAYFFVCNYSGRFFSNTRPYEAGTACSNCPVAYPRCRYNLCVTEEMLTGCEGYNGTTIYISATRTNSVSDDMNCPGFAVDPTEAPETTAQSQTTDSGTQSTTDPSNNQNTTDADGGSCRVTFSSVLTTVLYLSSFYLFIL